MHERMSLLQFVREVVEPYIGKEDVRVEAVVTGPPGRPARPTSGAAPKCCMR